MNHTDVEVIIPNQFMAERDRLDLIFERQHQLMEKYEAIEHANGFIHESIYKQPIDFDNRFAQARIKDFCWRVTEEIGEMLEPHEDPHFLEELSDVLHFMTELCIMCNIKPDDIIGRSFHEICRLESYWRGFMTEWQTPLWRHANPVEVLDIIRKLAEAANCLKMKPWKQTTVLTDIPKFKLCIVGAYLKTLKVARKTGITADGLFRLYYAKSEVNNVRIRTKY